MTLEEMGRRFHAASNQSCGFDAAAFTAMMDKCAENGGLFQSARGFVAGMIAQAWCDPQWRIAVELAWWSEDGRGLYLLREFERWAVESGAKEIRMTTLHTLPKAGKILARRGYAVSEHSWTRLV